MTDVLVIGIILLVVGIAVKYILKAKRSGVKCIGCPSAGMCSGKGEGHEACNCGCHCTEK